MEILAVLCSSEMLLGAIRLAIPLALAATGATICERSGIVNLGIEGMMLTGAFGAVLGSFLSGNPWVGVLTAMLFGGGVGFIHAVLCVKFKTNQSVSGIGINILASGLTIVLTRAVWNSDGMSGQVEKVPTFTIPVLNKIPWLGVLFEKQTPLLPITLLIVLAVWLFMYRSKAGLRLRAIGDHPQAAGTVGITVSRYRYAAVVFCGMLCGLAGGYLSIVQNNLFVKDMVAGRGFMALAAMILGGWNPAGALGASLIFAYAQALRMNLKIEIPSQFMLMLPYVLTVFVLVAFGRKARGPLASGTIEE